MADEIRLWSEELARDPSSLVFLQLSEALRRQGQLEVALKIALRGLERHQRNPEAHDLVARIAVDRRDFPRAHDEWEAVLRLVPNHLGAMKGLGYVSFQQGRFEEAEEYLKRAAATGGGADVTTALETVRRSSGGLSEALVSQALADADAADAYAAEEAARAEAEAPARLFSDLLLDDAQATLLLDANGYVLAGAYFDAEGQNVSQDVGAQLSGISEEVRRSTRHLDIGEWRSITFETHQAVVAMAPGVSDSLIVVAASRATPLGLLRRLLERCATRAADWLIGGQAT